MAPFPEYEAMPAQVDERHDYEKNTVLIFVIIFIAMFTCGALLVGVLKGIFYIFELVSRLTRCIKNAFMRCLRRPVSPPAAPPVELDGIELQSSHDRPKPPGYRTSVPSSSPSSIPATIRSQSTMPTVPPTAHAFYARHGPNENPPTYQSLYQRIEELQSQSAQGRFTNSRRTSQDDTRYSRRYV